MSKNTIYCKRENFSWKFWRSILSIPSTGKLSINTWMSVFPMLLRLKVSVWKFPAMHLDRMLCTRVENIPAQRWTALILGEILAHRGTMLSLKPRAFETKAPQPHCIRCLCKTTERDTMLDHCPMADNHLSWISWNKRCLPLISLWKQLQAPESNSFWNICTTSGCLSRFQFWIEEVSYEDLYLLRKILIFVFI